MYLNLALSCLQLNMAKNIKTVRIRHSKNPGSRSYQIKFTVLSEIRIYESYVILLGLPLFLSCTAGMMNCPNMQSGIHSPVPNLHSGNDEPVPNLHSGNDEPVPNLHSGNDELS